MNDAGPFSQRFGFECPEADITVRADAPQAVRDAVVMLGYQFGKSPKGMRALVCEVLLRRPNAQNWGDEPVEREVAELVDNAPWFKVYDIAEALYGAIEKADYTAAHAASFEAQLNQVFREHGVGWLMDQGRLQARGSEVFAAASRSAIDILEKSSKATAAREMHQALEDLARRPADVTGAIQHAMAALECVARGASADNDTFGKIVKKLDVPKPLDTALDKLWGFASEQGRHVREGRDPRFEDAELVVTVASAVVVYLKRLGAMDEEDSAP